MGPDVGTLDGALVGPAVGENVEQAADPLELAQLPAAHARHTVCPVAFWYVPALQSEQPDTPVRSEYRPVEHGRHPDAPAASWYVPAWQLAQLLMPKSLANRPSGQSVQTELEELEALPTVHLIHSVEPTDEATAPQVGWHWLHADDPVVLANEPTSQGRHEDASVMLV